MHSRRRSARSAHGGHAGARRLPRCTRPHIAGLSIAVVSEGFGHRSSQPDVEAAARRASMEFIRLGAKVHDISLPWHRDGLAIWLVFAMEGYFTNLVRGNGFGGNHDGLQWSGLNNGIARW